LKSNYSPGKRSFMFIVPLNVFMTTQCAEASTKGLMFSVTHGRKWMPSVDCFCFLNICKRFSCCSLDIYLHRTSSLKDILSSFE
jgi:membrane protein CcdC involved in cytochrome C biogenesis